MSFHSYFERFDFLWISAMKHLLRLFSLNFIIIVMWYQHFHIMLMLWKECSWISYVMLKEWWVGVGFVCFMRGLWCGFDDFINELCVVVCLEVRVFMFTRMWLTIWKILRWRWMATNGDEWRWTVMNVDWWCWLMKEKENHMREWSKR